jgi:hypothetical protein
MLFLTAKNAKVDAKDAEVFSLGTLGFLVVNIDYAQFNALAVIYFYTEKVAKVTAKALRTF